MKSILITTLVCTSALAAASALAQDQSHYDRNAESDSRDASMNDDSSSPGNFVKDSLITTKVKSKLAEKHMSTLTNVHVDTDSHGVVWLSGKAPTQDASDLAEMIAKDTDGVVSVHNKIVVAN